MIHNSLYNINDYLSNIVKEMGDSKMTLEGVLTKIKGSTPVKLLNASHKSIHLIKKEPFYVGTNFKQISSNLNPRFILVSAPGATGKSAFAEFIAYKHNSIYWNLSELIIGDGSFQGTLYKALGALNISNYAKLLQNGDATLVIDALDEAEVISGRRNVETFLLEANDFLEDANGPSIVVLSRTETAQNIATLFKSHTIPYIHFEIDYFPNSNAKEYVLKTVENKRNVTPAIEKCVDEYFAKVQSIITDKDTLKNFLGYAPVLQAIATHITEISNTSALLSDLKDNSDEVFLINNVMENLLQREHDKLTCAFKERLQEDQIEISNWDLIYDKEEQLSRLLYYILLNDIDTSSRFFDNIPYDFIDDYVEMLKVFLPQHPFIQNAFSDGLIQNPKIDFAGPAFRDYCLAYALLNGNDEASAELYYQQEAATSRFPSPLFWNHYIDLSNNHINSKHFAYVYEAYRSKTSIGSQASLDVLYDNFDSKATFSITKDNKMIETTTLDLDVYDYMAFDSIINTSIDADCTVSVGQKDNCSIENSAINCKSIILCSNTVSIQAFDPGATFINCEKEIKYNGTIPPNVIVNNQGTIKIDFPNIFEFPKCFKYKVDLKENKDSEDIYTFIYYLRKIFSYFRTHKKDMPARDAEKIDYVVVAESPIKSSIFNFLKDKSIIFRQAHLYKINMEKLAEYGISWGALTTTNTKQLEKAYVSFCEWKSQ